MKKVLIIKYCFLLALLMMFSCETEDNTGYSTIVPSTPTITVTGIPANANFVEMDSTFTFTVTLSVPQVVDVAIYAKQIDELVDGIAEEGKDFKIVNDGGKLTIPAGSTTGQFKISVLIDDEKEETETATIQIGDETTANAKITPVTFEFTIGNYLTDELSVDMSWDTDVLDVVGDVGKDPEEVVDMRMLIIDAEDNTIVADGSAFESSSAFDTLSDGVYRVAADIYSTLNFGDINEPLSISLSLAFNQPGAINDTVLAFKDVMTNENACSSYRTYLATVTKSGTTYTVAKEVSNWIDPFVTSPEGMSGTWSGYDTDPDYSSEIVSFVVDDTLVFEGIGRGWMQDAWGEVIITQSPVQAIFDPEDGTYTIPNQQIMTTTYEGDDQAPYFIECTVYPNFCGGPDAVIQYDFIQPDGGGAIAKYFRIPYFEAVISLDVSAKKSFTQNSGRQLGHARP